MSDASEWQPIDTAPSDEPVLVYTASWGPIIAVRSGEFGEWLSRMQVPVSIADGSEAPSHWHPLPAPPADAAGADEPDAAPADGPA